jgi:hypothetical protein
MLNECIWMEPQTSLCIKSKSDEVHVKPCFGKIDIEYFPIIHPSQRFEVQILMKGRPKISC